MLPVRCTIYRAWSHTVGHLTVTRDLSASLSRTKEPKHSQRRRSRRAMVGLGLELTSPPELSLPTPQLLESLSTLTGSPLAPHPTQAPVPTTPPKSLCQVITDSFKLYKGWTRQKSTKKIKIPVILRLQWWCVFILVHNSVCVCLCFNTKTSGTLYAWQVLHNFN